MVSPRSSALLTWCACGKQCRRLAAWTVKSRRAAATSVSGSASCCAWHARCCWSRVCCSWTNARLPSSTWHGCLCGAWRPSICKGRGSHTPVLCSHDTDNFIQQTVREHFRATLITIAHRLQTVTDYDKVLVMDKGRAVEYGAPVDLIQGDGLFATLVDAAGPQAALQLRADIEAAAKAKAQAASQS